MQSKTVGHVWNQQAGVSPCIQCATNYQHPTLNKTKRSIYPHWVLDYNFSKSDLYKVATTAGRWKTRQAKIAHLYPPNTPYWEKPIRKSMWVNSAWVIFSGGDISGLQKLIEEENYARFVDSNGIIGQILLNAANIGHTKGENGFWEAQSILCDLISRLLKSDWLEKETYRIRIDDAAETTDIVSETDNYFRAHLSERVTLKDIARHLHVSPSTLSHTYKRLTSQSPMSKMIELRIGLAKNLLLRGQRLKNIAQQTGFSDEYHLSKTFKRVEGKSPKQFTASRFH